MVKKPIIISLAILIILPVVSLLGGQQVFAAATITVNSNLDTVADDGACTLREAITSANSDTASGVSVGECTAGSGSDTIAFSIGTGLVTITPSTPLPNITSVVAIDGTTQPGGATCGTNFADRNLLIELSGATINNTGNNLFFETGSNGSSVKGLVVNNVKTGPSSVNAINLRASSIAIQCNNISTNVAGTASASETGAGLALQAGSSNNQIGGTGAGEGNIMSGALDGITMGGGNDNNIIQGNWIGVGSNGLCIGNGTGQGMSILGNGNTIGGNSAAARNVISCHDTPGFGTAMDLIGSDNTIQGNYIGTDTDGNVSPGYGNMTAIPVIATASNNLIGGSGAGEGNIIAGNGLGIAMIKFGANTPANNTIIGNSIYDNQGGSLSDLGIDLVETNDFVTFTSASVTANDAEDADSGPNDYLNYPVLATPTYGGGNYTVNYKVDVPAGDYRVEFFGNTAADPSGNGEGETLLSTVNITATGAAGLESFSHTFAGTAGQYISATITEIDGSGDGFGATSEFSGYDTDGDGIINSIDTDDDHDGILDTDEGSGVTDTDGDGTPDSLDIDSDGDGIVDNVEAQAEDATYVPPTGNDTDNDGLDDAYDTDDGGTAIVIADTDGDTTPDFQDTDSDNDTVPDSIEGHDSNADGIADVSPDNADADGDGLDDAYDTFDNSSPDPALNPVGSNAPLQDSDSDTTRDWRDTDDDGDTVPTIDEDVSSPGDPTTTDTDNDGTPNYLDTDDDNDTVPTIDEDVSSPGDPTATDTDGDGTPNYLDTDDDNDGILTVNELGDENNDGIPDYLQVPASSDPLADTGDNQKLIILVAVALLSLGAIGTHRLMSSKKKQRLASR